MSNECQRSHYLNVWRRCTLEQPQEPADVMFLANLYHSHVGVSRPGIRFIVIKASANTHTSPVPCFPDNPLQALWASIKGDLVTSQRLRSLRTPFPGWRGMPFITLMTRDGQI